MTDIITAFETPVNTEDLNYIKTFCPNEDHIDNTIFTALTTLNSKALKHFHSPLNKTNLQNLVLGV